MSAHRSRALYDRCQPLHANRYHANRYIVLLAALMLLGALLAGCAAPAPADAPADAELEAEATSSVAPATTVQTDTVQTDTAQTDEVVIAHEKGELHFSDVPQRVIALEYSYIDALVALDITPIGYADDGVPAYLLTYLQGTDAVSVGSRSEPNLELISSLHPDLIIADMRRHEEIYDQLSAIAPTLIFDSYYGTYENQIAIFQALSRVFDKEEMAAEAVDAAYAALDEARQVSADHERSIIVGVLGASGFGAHSIESFKGSLLADLHLPTPIEPLDGQTQFTLDLEGIASVNPEAIVVTCAPEDRGLWEAWTSQPVWQQLDAVKNNHVYVFNRDLWSKSRGIVSLHLLLRDAHESGLLAGEPSRSTTCPDPVIE